MVTLPTGSLLGVVLISAVVGLVAGRSGRFMKGMGALHARAHSGDSSASATGGVAEGGHSDQRVQTVVVVGRDGEAIDRTVVDEIAGGNALGESVRVVDWTPEPSALAPAGEARSLGTVDRVGPGRYDLTGDYAEVDR